jgi:hypothetical protein
MCDKDDRLAETQRREIKKDFAEKYPKVEILTKKTDMSKKTQVLAFAKFVLSKWKTVLWCSYH